jgi:amino acid permease
MSGRMASDGVGGLATAPSEAMPASASAFPHRSLSTLEATSLMVGAGVGAGIMAVPALAARSGPAELAAILLASWALSSLVHLLIVEVSLRTQGDLQLIELMRLYLLRGRLAWLVWIAFALLLVAFVAALAAYVLAAARIVTSLTGASVTLSQLLVYAASAGVVMLGLRAVGWMERLGAAALVACVGVLLAGALGEPFELRFAAGTEWLDVLALYGLVMYGYATYFAVPQVVQGLAGRPRLAARAVMAGLLVNGLLMGAVVLVALGVSDEVTEVAMVGIAAALGPWLGGVGSLFVLVALLTTYWSVSLALTDILEQRTAIDRRVCWLMATLPSILLPYAGMGGFIEWLSVAAGATATVVALITVPMAISARRHGQRDPGWSLDRLGGPVMLAVAFLASLLMALGAVRAM